MRRLDAGGAAAMTHRDMVPPPLPPPMLPPSIVNAAVTLLAKISIVIGGGVGAWLDFTFIGPETLFNII